jgi:hypothetical protein
MAREEEGRTWTSRQIHDHRGAGVLLAACAFLYPRVRTVRLNDDKAVLYDSGGVMYAVQCYYPGASHVRVKATRFTFARRFNDVGDTADLVLLRLADIGSTPSDPFGILFQQGGICFRPALGRRRGAVRCPTG